MWTQPWNEKRLEQGVNFNLMKELKNDRPNYRMYTRVDREQFEDLLLKVEGSITRQNTKFRSAISAVERLAVTLRYLATGRLTASMFLKMFTQFGYIDET